MATTNENKTREITNDFTGTSPSFTYTPIQQTVLATGITSIDLGFDDVNNELEIAITFVGDAPKADFIANGSIAVGDVIFDNLSDLGAGLDVVQVIPVADEATMQADIDTIINTNRIEIRY